MAQGAAGDNNFIDRWSAEVFEQLFKGLLGIALMSMSALNHYPGMRLVVAIELAQLPLLHQCEGDGRSP
jgi:hypothetical protein